MRRDGKQQPRPPTIVTVPRTRVVSPCASTTGFAVTGSHATNSFRLLSPFIFTLAQRAPGGARAHLPGNESFDRIIPAGAIQQQTEAGWVKLLLRHSPALITVLYSLSSLETTAV